MVPVLIVVTFTAGLVVVLVVVVVVVVVIVLTAVGAVNVVSVGTVYDGTGNTFKEGIRPSDGGEWAAVLV